ncbi:MAG: hypothetical protein MJ053_00305 [Elusimicrobiaceae bacterium]|nr:hypothetical protein [Elusimicrobiaceae bacterium]
MKKLLCCIPLLCALCFPVQAQQTATCTANLQRKVTAQVLRQSQWAQLLKEHQGDADAAVRAYGGGVTWNDYSNTLSFVNVVYADGNDLLVDLATILAWRNSNEQKYEAKVTGHKLVRVVRGAGFSILRDEEHHSEPLPEVFDSITTMETAMLWKADSHHVAQYKQKAIEKEEQWWQTQQVWENVTW